MNDEKIITLNGQRYRVLSDEQADQPGTSEDGNPIVLQFRVTIVERA